MSEESFSFTADNGDSFDVQPCAGEPGCVVISRRVKGLPHDEDHPAEDMHLPADVVPLVMKALAVVGPIAAAEMDID